MSIKNNPLTEYDEAPETLSSFRGLLLLTQSVDLKNYFLAVLFWALRIARAWAV